MAGEVSAIAQALGAISQTVGIFTSKAAERYRYTKGVEAGTVAYEQQKKLAGYQSLSNTRMMMYVAAFVSLIVILYVLHLKGYL